jgi:hypothetical protein
VFSQYEEEVKIPPQTVYDLNLYLLGSSLFVFGFAGVLVITEMIETKMQSD